MDDQGPLRLSVDRSKCEGHGMCEQVAPKLIQLNEDAEPVFDLGDIPPADRPLADAAVQCCPVAALSVYTIGETEAHRSQDLHEPPEMPNRAPLLHK
ncbi:ferredoxin [Mycobacterium sp. 663a-19]|uniref:ferredoxin n=1 Tax=Mycobacterium sp. 663a-19 TaxID=2986148 RepID=UPI002D1EAEAA|nr:ferredoxin [Mycobacterium sp. 663a-19]MEB3980137.1 ferredoxin [Mycobacterium sp. 663a-19]